jgi:translation initiation factor 3 subunit L
MNKMSAGDLSEFESSFNHACPKFLSPVPPSFDFPIGVENGSLHKEPLRLQLNVFMGEVRQQVLLPTIR